MTSNALPVPAWREQVRFDDAGLVPCIAQDATTGEVLMMAWMNGATLDETIATGRMVYWSRSRSARWAKGETSGATQTVRSLHLDCDGDAVLALVEQAGAGACHRGTRTCWDPAEGDPALDAGPRPVFAALWNRVTDRDVRRPEGSYTTSLLEAGVDRAGKKLGEEAVEVVIAAKNAAAGQGTAELAEESADLLYHLFVLWRSVGISPNDVLAALARRG
ncbi:MAG: bifunctional phosphoribosyl-AMP cyclohydrolase/phosphoribosyl-ATP diphosphatase HisIE [Deltaproteobacteria bacterium]|nr:MAG: bifunctional phosphoribosyl-AMP cyclohydrolase/phosphoribosyl-ATP diphosphatase HisIE [Deltaproteobacteria bacterium]